MTRWHLITCEYPPQLGGLADYSWKVATALAYQGAEVHVWCPRASADPPEVPGVTIHPLDDAFQFGSLDQLGSTLDRLPSPRRLLVQWAPHGYGYKSVNLFFCVWLWVRSYFHEDEIQIMFHEVWLEFGHGFLGSLAAALHRVMTRILLRAARRVWVSTAGWKTLLDPIAPPHLAIQTLPVPSNLPAPSLPEAEERDAVRGLRQRYTANATFLIGHFGSASPLVDNLLQPVIVELLRQRGDITFLLIGAGSETTADNLFVQHPYLRGRLHATGTLPGPEIAHYLRACDLVVQPYPDGVSTRRGSTMAVLSVGRPLVTTSGHLTEPLWAQSNAVVCVPAGSPEELVAAVHRLLSHPGERARLAAEGARLYDDRFDLRHTIAALRATE